MVSCNGVLVVVVGGGNGAAHLVDKVAGGGGLAGVHVADHHDVNVRLFLAHGGVVETLL